VLPSNFESYPEKEVTYLFREWLKTSSSAQHESILSSKDAEMDREKELLYIL